MNKKIDYQMLIAYITKNSKLLLFRHFKVIFGDSISLIFFKKYVVLLTKHEQMNLIRAGIYEILWKN